MRKRALVTGGAGFLGSHLCQRLLTEGYEVTALDNLYTGTMANLEGFKDHPAFTFVEQDVVVPYCGEFDEIYNLACPASPIHYQAKPLDTLWTAIIGLKNCLELAKQTGAKVLHASTSEIYGDPLIHPQVENYWGNVNTIGIRSCYDEGKRVGETIATEYRHVYGIDVRMVRIFNTYGPNMHPQDGRVISNFIMQALENKNLTIFGDGSQTRSFQYCDDLIEAFRRFMALDRKKVEAFFDGKLHPEDRVGRPRPAVPVINTGNPNEYTIGELAQKTLAMMPESKSKVVYCPLPLDDPKKRKPDIAFARLLLDGWAPQVLLDEGLARTIAYFRVRYGGNFQNGINTNVKEGGAYA